jgi:hypothetical protein
VETEPLEVDDPVSKVWVGIIVAVFALIFAWAIFFGGGGLFSGLLDSGDPDVGPAASLAPSPSLAPSVAVSPSAEPSPVTTVAPSHAASGAQTAEPTPAPPAPPTPAPMPTATPTPTATVRIGGSPSPSAATPTLGAETVVASPPG